MDYYNFGYKHVVVYTYLPFQYSLVWCDFVPSKSLTAGLKWRPWSTQGLTYRLGLKSNSEGDGTVSTRSVYYTTRNLRFKTDGNCTSAAVLFWYCRGVSRYTGCRYFEKNSTPLKKVYRPRLCNIVIFHFNWCIMSCTRIHIVLLHPIIITVIISTMSSYIDENFALAGEICVF